MHLGCLRDARPPIDEPPDRVDADLSSCGIASTFGLREEVNLGYVRLGKAWSRASP